MGKGYLIDSNVIIGYLDNKIPSPGMELINTIVDGTPYISVISKIEVLRFNAPENVYQILEDFIGDCFLIGLDESIVDQTIAICKSHRIKLPDAIIAATAIVNNLTLLTRNVGDFKNIADLDLLDPWEVAG